MSVQLCSEYERQFRPTGYNDIDTNATTVPHRRRTLYAKTFARNDLLSARPNYFNTPGIPPADVKRIARFKIGSHYLSAVTGAWTQQPFPSRLCTRCHSTTQIDDETHLLFHCASTLDLRSRGGDLLEILHASDDNLKTFLANTNVTATHLYVSHCMKIVDTAQQPQG